MSAGGGSRSRRPRARRGWRVLCRLPAAPAPRRLWALRAGPGAARGGPRCRRQGGERAASLLGCGGRGGSLRASPRGPGRRVPVPSLPGTLRLAAEPLGRQGVRSETFESRVAPGAAGGQAAGRRARPKPPAPPAVPAPPAGPLLCSLVSPCFSGTHDVFSKVYSCVYLRWAPYQLLERYPALFGLVVMKTG